MGCANFSASQRPQFEAPGEERLLDAGEPAPYPGVLIPKSIYKQALPAIDDAYEHLYETPRREHSEIGDTSPPRKIAAR